MNTLDARRRLLGRNVYKKTVEGTPAIAQGSLARRDPGITMQGWTEQDSYEGNQLIPLPVGKVIESESGKNTLTVTENGVNLNITEPTTSAYTNDIYIFGNSQYNIEAGYEDASVYIPQGLYTLLNDTITNLEVFLSVWRNGVKIDLISSVATRPANFTIMDGDKIRLGIRPKGTLEINNMMLMVIKQTLPSTTPFEPYTGNAPSPSPDYKQDVKNAGNYNEETQKYEYQVKLTGKNLFDTRRIRNLNSGTNAPDEYHINGNEIVARKSGGTINQMALEIGLSLKPGTYYFAYDSMEITNQNGETYSINSFITSSIRETASGDVVARISLTIPGNYTKVTIENDIDMYLSLSAIHEWESISELKIYGLRIVLNADTPFEPYKEQTVTITSDRPLTKWDKLEKRNGQWGWVYKSAEKVLDGTEGYVTGSGNYISDFSSNCYTVISDMVIDGRDNAFMNRLSNIDYSWTLPDAIGFSKNLDQLHVRISNADLGTTGESSSSEVNAAMKAYVAQQYEEGNPFVFWYETAEETFVPLSSSEQEQMNELYTFRPTTVLSNDCECEMTLTYKTKKSLEVTT